MNGLPCCLILSLLFFIMTSVDNKKRKKNKRHISHDGSIREYDYKTHEWIIIKSSSSNKSLAINKPLAIEGRLFDTNKYFPHLFNKSIMSLDVLSKKYLSTFTINNHPLYIGNMINNQLKSRNADDQQHGDTGNNLWDSSILFTKAIEYNTFNNNNNNNDDDDNILNVSNKTIIELGTGTGFVGLAAIHCNAKFVYLTDLDYCIKNIQINVEKNKFLFNEMKKNNNNNNNQCELKQKDDDNPFDNVDVFELDWINYKQSLSKYDKIEKNSVDIIIGVDVIWIKELVPMLVNTLEYLYQNVLNKQNGIIIIAEQVRSSMVSQLFWSLMKEKGFKKSTISNKLYHPSFTSHKIFISIASK